MIIYLNEKPIQLLSEENAALAAKTPQTLVVVYRGNVKLFHQIVDIFEKKNNYDGAIIVLKDAAKGISEFRGIFKTISAAGGIVFNENNLILSIFRRGFWDLPKGKIDRGESESEAAMREVREETGLQNLELLGPVGTTYHIYTLDKKRILKPTFWFAMRTTETALIPQVEEDIESAVWLSKEELLENDRKIYRNIVEILKMV